MKKERKKEIKAAEGKMAKLEERLHEMRRTRQGSGPSASKFNVDTPPSSEYACTCVGPGGDFELRTCTRVHSLCMHLYTCTHMYICTCTCM